MEEFSDSDDNDKGSRLWATDGALGIEDDGCGLFGQGINYTKKMNPTNWSY